MQSQQPVQLWEIWALIRARVRLVLALGTLGLVAAGAWVVLVPRPWEATQTLLLRDEAMPREALGRFRDLEQMKLTQETVLQMALSERVLRRALGQVSHWTNHPFHSASEAVEQLRRRVRLEPPQGVELGQSEILFLRVRHPDRQQAVRLVRAVAQQLQQALLELRRSRAESIVAELKAAVQVAQEQLQHYLQQLQEIEAQLGPDLAELRSLEQSSGGSALREQLNQLQSELRQVQERLTEQQALAQLLRQVQADPNRLLATPNRLLESQPALRRLKEGLIDAQLRTAQLQGALTAEHPRVQAALDAEELVRKRLRRELKTALAGLEVEQELSRKQIRQLQQRIGQLQSRLERVARLRAPYATLSAQVEHQLQLVRQAQQKLAVAQAMLKTDQRASVLSLVGEAGTGPWPVGPRRSLILLIGVLGSLALGAALAVLLGPPGVRTSEAPTNSHPQSPVFLLPPKASA